MLRVCLECRYRGFEFAEQQIAAISRLMQNNWKLANSGVRISLRRLFAGNRGQ